MASRAKMRQVTEPGQAGAEVGRRDRLPLAASEQEIRRRAYEIYLERGAGPGHELEDWLQAEHELTTNPSNLPGSSAA